MTFDIGPEKINKIWAKEYSLQSKTPEKLVAIATKCYQAQREARRRKGSGRPHDTLPMVVYSAKSPGSWEASREPDSDLLVMDHLCSSNKVGFGFFFFFKKKCPLRMNEKLSFLF